MIYLYCCAINLMNNLMKQNQRNIGCLSSLNEQQDFLKFKAHCTCSRCESIIDHFRPNIFIDHELNRLRMNRRPASQQACDLVVFFNNLRQSKAILPRIALVDTLIMAEGAAVFAVYSEEGKVRMLQHISAKQWTIQRKQQLDLRYQIRKYEQENPGFTFSSFQHRSEKKIKQFQNNIRYKMPSVLNRVAQVKLKHFNETALLSKNQFLGLFDSSKDKLYGLQEIEYIQVFPVMCGEEDHSYVRTVKYSRKRESTKRSFKLAECYVSTWKERNDSLEKLQQGVYQEICADGNLSEVTQEIRLQYLSCKLLIYYEDVCNVRVEEALLYFITNDDGKTFLFQKIECMKVQKRALVDNVARELPTHKEYSPEEYINLGTQMKTAFEGFQTQFDRVERQRREMEIKVEKDKHYSNLVFKTVTQRKSGSLNFHQILGGTDPRTKKQQLQL